MPFKPGEGGRRAGSRNKVGADARALFVQLGGANGQTYAEQLHQLAAHKDPHVRMKAITLIASYVWGKPTETVDLKADVTTATTIVHEHLGS